jgi:ABC-type multidrug transport system ATPase subunit
MVEFNLSSQFKADLDIYTGGYEEDKIQASSLIQTAFLGKALNYIYTAEELSNETQYSTPMINANSFYLPRNVRSGKRDIEDGFQLTFYWLFSMITLCLVMPILIQRIVIERGDGLVDLSRMMGLSRTAYWTANLGLDFGVYFIVLALLLIVAGISSSKVGIAMISPWVFFPFLIHGITCAFEAYFFSFFFRRLRPATLFAYVFSLAQMAVAAVFNMALVHPTDGFPGYLLWWPGLAFHRLTYLGLMNNATKNHWIRAAINKNLRDSMLCFCFETIILIGIVFVFDRWGPSKLGNRGTIGDLLRDFVSNKWRSFWSNRNKKNGQHGIDAKEAYELSGLDRLLVADEDQRVAAEREAVLSGSVEDPIMLVKNVTKVYAEGTKHFTALGGISLSLRAGDCFGLLGPNGAGKSTLVSILSGIMIPTSGSVSVARSEKRCCIGLCPQDDIFYEDLSVEEHLLYYARLKGKGPGEDDESVDQILSDTSMLDERRKYAKNLSGGQKRRLSVASALCGDPMVIFLDEPSSSLDPASRLALWEMIQDVSQTRCTLITTHSMEEAEVLCNRIGIIKDGMMVCLGTPTQLKKDYGRGYKLTASMLHGRSIQPVLDEVLKVAPAASISSHRHGTFEIQLGANAMLSKVSQCVESQSKLGIEYWSLSRNGLDEVFLRIVEDRGVMRRKKDGTLAPKKSAWDQKLDKDASGRDSSSSASEEEAHLGEESV